jgi:two-component system CheB/CheR fusion protein
MTSGSKRGSGRRSFPIVGVGASAGGLDAFRQLLAHVPADAGLALVLVQHLDPTRGSLLSDALAQATSMPVAQAGQDVLIEPNHVYVIPPGAQMAIEEGMLRLSPLEPDERRPHLPIDYFFRSLAEERGSQGIGVVLSGTGADGTGGLAAIRAQGGITFAQDPRVARSGEMPQSAVDAGVVDFCLAIPALGAELDRLARHPYLAPRGPEASLPAGAATLTQIIELLRTATGVDFGEHKPATFKRRLARRMLVRRSKDLGAYLELLRIDAAEVAAFHDDLLIKVTSFFRDEGTFEELKTAAFPEIMRHKAPGAPFRAWVVGCSTGEEVYSLAMAILEHLGDETVQHPVLIFGSDLSQSAIDTARAGFYPDAAVQGISEARLKRFFVRAERGWRVGQAMRDLCVFVRHDVARDPPFAKLDLLSCRNVLIYFSHSLQRRVLAAAHYCLNLPGYLLLGRSESAASAPRWFSPISPGARLFRRRPGPSTFRFAPATSVFPAAPAAFASTGRAAFASTDRAAPRPGGGLARQVEEQILARYGPPAVVVNDLLEVLQFRGRTGPYLEPPAGEPQSLLLKMAKPGLAGPLRVALAQARKTSAPVRRELVVVDGIGGLACDLVVLPIMPTDHRERTFVVLFEERPIPAAPRPLATGRGKKGAGLDAAARLALESELTSTREHVAALVEEHGRDSDALSTVNDELVSSNEELQSLNEELETAKEELQSTNEELTTVNDELLGRNQDLVQSNGDVLNLLDAVEIPILMLDREHRLRRFTRLAASSLGLVPGDLGRRLADISLPLRAPDLEGWIARATEDSIMVEAEVQDSTDRWMRVQVRPRHAPDGQVDGTILSLVDVDALRHEVIDARWARDHARGIVEAVPVPLLVLEAGLHVVSANAAYYRQFGQTPGGTEGGYLFELGDGVWDAPALRQALAALSTDGRRFQGLELEREVPGAGRRTTWISGCTVPSPVGPPLVLLSIEDVTERKQEERRRAELSQALRGPLASILQQAGALQGGGLDGEGAGQAGQSIVAEARRGVSLVEELLDGWRLGAAKVSLQVLVRGILDAASKSAATKAVQLESRFEGEPPRCLGDPARLRQVVSSLVANAVTITPPGGRVDVHMDTVDGFARLAVTDSGRGFEPDALPHLFEPFARNGSTAEQPPVLGLALAQQLAALHGGAVRAESPGRGLGSTFTLTLPRKVRTPYTLS